MAQEVGGYELVDQVQSSGIEDGITNSRTFCLLSSLTLSTWEMILAGFRRVQGRIPEGFPQDFAVGLTLPRVDRSLVPLGEGVLLSASRSGDGP